MDHDTIYWALPTEAGWGLWLFLICFLENYLLQFLIFICALESLSSGSRCLSCPSSQPFYTSKLSQQLKLLLWESGRAPAQPQNTSLKQVCPLLTPSEDFLMRWEYSTNTQKFWQDWCLPLKSLVADIPVLLSKAAIYPALFSGVAQQYKSFHELGALCEAARHPCKVAHDSLDFETVIHSSVILRHSCYFR